MWLLVAREPRPDAPDWPGRRLLAAVDAVTLAAAVGAADPLKCQNRSGLVGPFVTALAVLCAAGRLHRALWVNHRYWFTTWRWGKVAAAMLVIGAILKLTLPV